MKEAGWVNGISSLLDLYLYFLLGGWDEALCARPLPLSFRLIVF